MKTSSFAVALVLALSASAAPQGTGRKAPTKPVPGVVIHGGSSTSAAVNLASASAVASSGKGTTGQSGNNAAGNNTATATSDPQTSLTLDPRVIATGFANNGQDVAEAGQVASLTSTNNFINYCLTVPNLPITNGKQITTGSCNVAPMGVIPSTDNMPSAKFQSPKNGDVLPANTAFTITMAIQNMQTGFFTNAQENYFAAPQFLNSQGQIQGHSHTVIESLTALDQTTPTNPKNFVFFKGLNVAAVNGLLTADVTSGLPAGFYKLSSINTAANHQPVLVPIAQHGSLDDAVYFTVSDSGAAGNATASSAATGTAASTSAAAGAATGTAASTSAAASAAATSAKVTLANGANGGKVATSNASTGKTGAASTGKTVAASTGKTVANGANGGKVDTSKTGSTGQNTKNGKRFLPRRSISRM